MKLIEDMGNKVAQHTVKNRWWASNGVDVIRLPLPVGDYILVTDKVQDVIDRKTKRGLEPKKMDFLGTYSVSVDSKRDMNEIEGNIIGKSHARFRDELILAQNNNIQLYIVVENTDGIKSISDVFRYTSPRLLRWCRINKLHSEGKSLHVVINPKPPISGEKLAKCMLTMEKRYGVKFVFCKPAESGKVILDLLTGADNG